MENKLGNCFQVAYRTFSTLWYRGNYRLVHGMIDGQGPVKGLRFVHAWVENIDTGMVIDNTLPEGKRLLPQRDYYSLAHVQADQLSKYTTEQVLEYAINTGIYGPWEDKYNKVIKLYGEEINTKKL